jgi:hypothetical protein
MQEDTTFHLPTDAPLSVIDGVRRDFVPVDDETFAITETQDVEPILEFNKVHANDGSGGWSPSRDLRHVTRIPMVVALDWFNKFGVDVLNKDHKAAVARLLNSSDYAYLRTGAGVLAWR